MILVHTLLHSGTESIQVFHGPDANAESRAFYEAARENHNVDRADLYINPVPHSGYQCGEQAPELEAEVLLPRVPRGAFTGERPELNDRGARYMVLISRYIHSLRNGRIRFLRLQEPLRALEREADALKTKRDGLIQSEGDAFYIGRKVAEVDATLEVLRGRIATGTVSLADRADTDWKGLCVGIAELRALMREAVAATAGKLSARRAALTVALVRQWNPAFAPSPAWLEIVKEGAPDVELSHLPENQSEWTLGHLTAVILDAARVQNHLATVENLQALTVLPVEWESLLTSPGDSPVPAVESLPLFASGDSPQPAAPRGRRPATASV